MAGILASTFSTPLSHVNLRATAWDIPNAGYKQARDVAKGLDGKVVFFEVRDDGMTPARGHRGRQGSARAWWRRGVDLPPADLTNRDLAMLTRMRAKDVTIYGTKASNLGEIRTAALPGVNIPDG
ncbi:MAG: hypothetical protein IPI49_33545 [Myxococcales bacterium]|nr:hypothetical protein [Myxococcales bacterium]